MVDLFILEHSPMLWEMHFQQSRGWKKTNFTFHPNYGGACSRLLIKFHFIPIFTPLCKYTSVTCLEIRDLIQEMATSETKAKILTSFLSSIFFYCCCSSKKASLGISIIDIARADRLILINPITLTKHKICLIKYYLKDVIRSTQLKQPSFDVAF